MDAKAALDRLREISAQVRSAVIFERGGKVVASTLGDDERAAALAREAEELLAQAERRRPGGGGSDGGGEFAQLEVALQRGSVFVVRHDDRLITATTSSEPTVGLVFYDLKTCLRDLEEPEPALPKKPPAKRKPRTTRKKPDAES
jgi:predicted regulator of Ras-like GTPase activity (Roadblock/LC7/MglB family)